MPTTPHPPPKPSTPPQPPVPKPEAAKATSTPPIGAKPDDPKDPQAIKFEPPQSAPPRWDEKTVAAKPTPDWTPKAALDPLSEKPPAGVYADGMSSAQEQRLRSAWIEEHGLKAYDEATDQRPDDEKPKFDPHALAGGGAFVSPSAMKQVPGVVPPTKRE